MPQRRAAQPPSPGPTMKRKEAFWRIALLSLPLAVFGVFVIWPLLNSFYYSFTTGADSAATTGSWGWATSPGW